MPANVTVKLTPAEAALANAKDYLADALRRRSNNISRAQRLVRQAQAALDAERGQ